MSERYGVLTRSGDACKVTFERDYATTSADLWSALTEPDRLTRWLAPVDGNLHEGGHAVVHFDDGDARFVIEVCAAPKTLIVHWQHADGHSVVRASVFDLGEDHCLLTLVHDALSAQQAPGYAGGWHFHLDSLDRLLAESGAARRRWRELAEHYRTAMGDPS